LIIFFITRIMVNFNFLPVEFYALTKILCLVRERKLFDVILAAASSMMVFRYHQKQIFLRCITQIFIRMRRDLVDKISYLCAYRRRKSRSQHGVKPSLRGNKDVLQCASRNRLIIFLFFSYKMWQRHA